MIRYVPRAAQAPPPSPQTPADLDALAADYVRLGIAALTGYRITFGAYADLTPAGREILADAAARRLRDWRDNPREVLGHVVLLC